tara:strand:- start:1511 stop:2353 length:843 start_codon:yes stop_codon:yes gene_type:complete
MYFLLNFVIWIRKNLIRVIVGQYPNYKLKSNHFEKGPDKKLINIISSTDNFWVSKMMFNKWNNYRQRKDINLSIYSNENVNDFMYKYFQDELIYELFKRSVIPVQKMDIFRICFVYKYGGIWLDLKSEINIDKAIYFYEKSNSKGLLLVEPRKIEVIKQKDGKIVKSFEKVIHNGFFFLPKESIFLKHLIEKLEKDFLYFQDVDLTNPKQAIMNLTGPHQFTRQYHQINNDERPLLITHQEIGWEYCSKYGEFISPFIVKKHYSLIKNQKTIDSKKITFL